MKLAFIGMLLAAPAAAAPRALPAPAPIHSTEAAPVRGGRLAVAAVPSLAAPRRLLLVGSELWIAADGGVGRLPADLGVDRPRLIRDADGASIGATYDLARVGAEVWAATDHGVVRIDARSGTVLGRALADRHVLAVDDGGAAATDRGVLRVRDGAVLAAAIDVHALARCGGARYGLAGGRVIGLGAAAPVVEGSAISIGCAGAAVVVGTDAGVRGRGNAEPITALAAVGEVLALGTLDGLRFAGPARIWRGDAPGRVWAVTGDRRGWWVAIDDELVRLRPGGDLERSVELSGPRGLVMAIEADGDAAWVGTFDDGLYRLEGDRYRRVATPDLRITALLADRGHLLVGTAAGLFSLDGGAAERVHDPQGRLERHVSALRRVGDRVLVGAYPGAVLLGADGPSYLTGRAVPARAGERAMFATTIFGAASTGEDLWLATQDGIERLDRSGASLIASIGGVLPDDWVNDVATLGDELFFVLADRGVGWLGPRGTTLLGAHLPTSCGSLRIIGDHAVFAGDGGIVVATRGEGARLTRYDAAQGIDLVVAALAFDAAADRLWAGGAGGVLRIDRAREQLGGGR